MKTETLALDVNLLVELLNQASDDKAIVRSIGDGHALFLANRGGPSVACEFNVGVEGVLYMHTAFPAKLDGVSRTDQLAACSEWNARCPELRAQIADDTSSGFAADYNLLYGDRVDRPTLLGLLRALVDTLFEARAWFAEKFGEAE